MNTILFIVLIIHSIVGGVWFINYKQTISGEWFPRIDCSEIDGMGTSSRLARFVEFDMIVTWKKWLVSIILLFIAGPLAWSFYILHYLAVIIEYITSLIWRKTTLPVFGFVKRWLRS